MDFGAKWRPCARNRRGNGGPGLGGVPARHELPVHAGLQRQGDLRLPLGASKRRGIALALAAGAMLSCGKPVRAAEPVTVKQMLDWCTSGQADASSGLCVGYLRAVADGLPLFPGQYCVQAAIPARLREAVAAHLRTLDPSFYSLPALLVVMTAFERYFPCPK